MNSTAGAVSSRYEEMVRAGMIEADESQRLAVVRLDCLAERLEQADASTSSGLFSLFRKNRRSRPVVNGLYIWGAVGRGKTMLMDIFFETVPVASRRRVHFHAFMRDMHARIHDWRQDKKAGKVRGDDPIGPLAKDLSTQCRLLCFDEFSVTDIADAMLLGRLFSALFAEGITIVATSNVEPARLYENGLNRALFVPFLKLMLERVEVLELKARTDFRLEKLSGEPVFLTPNDAAAREAMTSLFRRLTAGQEFGPVDLVVLGRRVRIPCASGHVARFDFADLCDQPLGAADYLAIAEQYHTVFIENIPRLGSNRRNPAKRFINLIDTLYDEKVKVIISAETPPQDIYAGEHGHEVFEFARTVSRLIEMQSIDYLAQPHGKGEAVTLASRAGIVET